MRYVYTFFAFPAALFFELRFFLAAWREGQNYDAWKQRLGFAPKFSDSPIWMHAVSVGEVQAISPLIKRLLSKYPHMPLLVTTTTSTGAEHIRQMLGDNVVHAYLPYDLPFAVKQFFARVKPRVGLVMETEIWPNLYHYASRKGIKLALINARLSERSTRRYQYVRSLMEQTLNYLSAIAAQAPADAERFISLGAKRSNVLMTGNVKFDIEVIPSQLEEAESLRRLLGSNRSIWIAASTHEGEDEAILRAFSVVVKELPEALLVLVPRHPERFDSVENLCKKQGFTVVRRSSQQSFDKKIDIFLGDTMGELTMFYAAADVAFVGGSLVEVGGHNLLEPAAVGLPVIVGPYTHNFEYICELLIKRGAARRITSAEALARVVIDLLRSPNLRDEAGEQGQKVIQENRGAVKTVMQLVANQIDSKNS